MPQTLVRSGIELEPSFNPEVRRYNDVTTLMAEMVDGQMRSEFTFTLVGNELYGEDGGALTPVFDDAIVDAERAAKWKPELAFQVPRVKTEREELDDILSMARGEGPNTMVIVSDFPFALSNARKDVGGYNVTRKQTMLRIITRREDGKIHMVSQSLDRSDRQALKEIYRYLGQEPEPGELLGQRIKKDLPEAEQEFLPDWLTGIYDRSLTSRHGGEWRAGRSPAELVNTYDFVRAQPDLIQVYLQRLDEGGNEAELTYELASALDKRYKKQRGSVLTSTVTIEGSYSMAAVEMVNAGREYALRGIVMSGCGLTLNESTPSSTEGNLNELGYSGEKCPEVKDGELVKCPGCKETVRAIVPNKETIYCSNPKCTLAHKSVKE